MKKICQVIILFMGMLYGISIVNAKNTLMTCEYYKAEDQLEGSPQAGILCNIFTDYSHQCYVEVGAAKATTSSNKEKIQNWNSAVGLSWKAKDYVQQSNQCPEYLVVRLKNGAWFNAGGYELHAAASQQEALDLSLKLSDQRYLAHKIGDASAAETAKAVADVQSFIDNMNDTKNNYSLNSCKNDNVISTRLQKCNDIISALESRMASYDTNVTNMINAGYLNEDDDIIKSYRETVENTENFINQAESELSVEEEKIKQEMGLADEDIVANPNNMSCRVIDNKYYDINGNEVTKEEYATSCNADCGIFSGRLGDFLKTILSFIRFAVPIIIIGLGIMDFLKATASQDNNEIKKAATKLVKRMVIGIIIFVLPTLIELILRLADIKYGTCGIR